MVMAPSAIYDSHDEYANSFYPDDTKSVNHGPEILSARDASKQLIRSLLYETATSVDTHTCLPGDEDPFFVADLGEIYRQHVRWKKNLPRVKPFYAVKCNPEPRVLQLMAALGINFDCASKAEVDLALAVVNNPSRIIYAQPCKTESFLRHASALGVKQMTFDNAAELYKIKRISPDAELFLRIIADDSSSTCRLSMKFGASISATRPLLELAARLDLRMVGVSFHVGSGAADPNAFVKSIEDARRVFDMAAELGMPLSTLDIGGGFCDETFELFAGAVADALDTHFPPSVNVIAEPGRYYVTTAFTIAANVIARRDLAVESAEAASLSSEGITSLPSPSPSASSTDLTSSDEAFMLYLNDGIYGNFSNIPFDHQHPVPRILSQGGLPAPDNDGFGAGAPVAYSVWGPTCDGIDLVCRRVELRGGVGVGDWLYFENMGAYTLCSRTTFNGFTNQHRIMWISTEPAVYALLEI